ncbi:unnamed protein product [Sphagnum jensenii]|uniref:Uncharacterized protein n=1 Tax=Sphagnum jensenii TaxID=128206 RepID=A0ABP1ALL7_9BRYO
MQKLAAVVVHTGTALKSRSNNVGVEEAAFDSIAPITGTCNVDDTLNSEDAVNTIMELFIKRHEGFVLEAAKFAMCGVCRRASWKRAC